MSTARSRNGSSRKAQVPRDAHEWISFEDPDEERTWIFDATFLLSGWTCIYGRGCQGVLTGPAPELVQGCCSYGAHISDKADAKRVEAAAKTLDDSQWQFRRLGRQGVLKRQRSGDLVTRITGGACIFLNRPGFPGGPGCALHRAALERGVEPLTLKPDVCWQLPLRREDRVADDGHVTSTVGQWDRRHWGAGGADFHWWCTEATTAYVGARPVYRTLGAELVALVGQRPYQMVAAYLDQRRAKPAPLPHPTVRRR